MIGVIGVAALCIVIGWLAITKGEKLFSIFLSLFAFGIVYELVVRVYGQTAVTLSFALASAVAGAILAQYAKKLSFFLLGLIGGVFLGAFIMPYIKGMTQTIGWIAVLLFGVVCGILTAHWNRIFLRLATGFLGGRVLGTGALFLVFHLMHLSDFAGVSFLESVKNTTSYLMGTFVNTYALYLLACSIICAVIAFFMQAKKHR